MKQKLIAFVVAVLSFVMLFTACQNMPTVTGVELTSAPQKITYNLNETFDATGGKLTYTYEDGTTEVKDVTAAMVTGFDSTAFGQKTVKIAVTENGKEYSFDFNYNVTSANVESLIAVIEALPDEEDVELSDKEDVDAAAAAYAALSVDEKSYFDATQEEVKEKLDAVVAKVAQLVENESQVQAELAEYRASKINALKALLKIAVFEGVTTTPALTEESGENASYVAPGKSYLASTVVAPEVDLMEKEEVADAVAYIEQAIATLESKDAIDVAFDIALADAFSAFKEDLVGMFTASINKVVDAWKSTISTQLARWTEETIGLKNQFNPITMDYNSEDGRWWGAVDKWEINTITASIASEFEAAETLAAVVETYNNIVFELSRATMQRNAEYFYAIERALNSKYDPVDVYYWNCISSYNSAETNMRLSHALYSPNEGVTSLAKAVEQYNYVMGYLAKDKLDVIDITINVMPVVVYEVGDTFSVVGGKLNIVYNDPNEDEVIEINDGMIVGEVVLDEIKEDVATLKFQTKAGEKTFKLSYSVVLDKELGASIVLYQTKVDEEINFLKEVYLNTVGGEKNGMWVLEKQPANISGNEAVLNAAKTLKDAIALAETSEEAEEIYTEGLEAYKLALRNEYKTVAIKNVKDMVNYMRDSVKFVWGTQEVENEDGTITTTDKFAFESSFNNGNGQPNMISTDYLDKTTVGFFNTWVPQMFNIAYVYDAIDFTVTANMNAEELFAAYNAAYFEVLRVVMNRNIYTVYFFNEDKLVYDEATGTGVNFWGSSLGWVNSLNGATPAYEYSGPFAAFEGQVGDTFIIWNWAFTPDDNSRCKTYAELFWWYNIDIATMLG